MTIKKKFRYRSAVFVAGILLVACAAPPQLVPKSGVVPAGIDFSGKWQLVAAPGANSRPQRPAEQGIRIPGRGTSRNSGKRSQKRSSGSAISVFLETGESLKITQTETGLFISFDRAIVEEYAFGENRMVSVGPIEAQRVSGWENETLVVETLDAEGGLLAESWRLEEAGTELVRDISIARGDKQQWFLRQRFDRD